MSIIIGVLLYTPSFSTAKTIERKTMMPVIYWLPSNWVYLVHTCNISVDQKGSFCGSVCLRVPWITQFYSDTEMNPDLFNI